MKNKYLTSVRHAERVRGTSCLTAASRAEAEAVKTLFREDKFGIPKITIASDVLYNQATAALLGFSDFIVDPRVSGSVEQYRNVPWKGTFRAVQESYAVEESTRELGDNHAGLYLDILRRLEEGEHGLVIAHDTRTEAALASLVGGQMNLDLGKGLGYLESCTMAVSDNVLKWIQVNRKRAVHRMPIEKEMRSI